MDGLGLLGLFLIWVGGTAWILYWSPDGNEILCGERPAGEREETRGN